MKLSGNTILITGGSAGIGQAFAWRFHDLGNTVIVTSRKLESLKATTDGRDNIHPRALDVDDPQAVKDFARRVVQDFPALNILYNNAGIMRFEALKEPRDLKDAEETVTTNLLGPIRMTDALVEHLGGRPDATIINVSSGLAFLPLIAAPTYSATKAAIHSYTITLREALRGKVEVIEFVIPAVQTELTPGQSTRANYMPLADFIDEMTEILKQQPTPDEVMVERGRFQRLAEREDRFQSSLETLNAPR